MNHCLFKAKDTKGAVGNTVDYSLLTINGKSCVVHRRMIDKYVEEEKAIFDYWDACMKEGMKMFTKFL